MRRKNEADPGVDALRAEIDRLAPAEDWQGIVDTATQETEIFGADMELSWNLGWAYFKLERLEEARKHLSVAIDLEPQHPAACWALGVVLRELEDYDEAERLLRRAVAIKDTYAARLALGNLYIKTRRPVEAEQVHREGVRLKPNHKARLTGLANLLWDLGRRDEAEEWYERARSRSEGKGKERPDP